MSRPPDETDRSQPERLASTIRHCPLCGNAFAENEHDGCPSCPINKYCRVVCCPECGYEFVEDSWLVERFKDLKSLIRSGREREGTADDA